MTLKYVGPKPIISHTGIEFDKNKEDKYVYLGIVAQLIVALDHEYIADKSYVYDKGSLSEQECLRILQRYCSNLDKLLDKTNHSVEEHIERDEDRAHENRILCEEDKCVLFNNIEIMRDYIIQRSVNKSVYYCALRALADIVQRGHIDHVTTPFSEKFAHVLHSLQGTLRQEKPPIDSKLDIFKKEGELLVKLQMGNLLNL
jgi:hypothetical protein